MQLFFVPSDVYSCQTQLVTEQTSHLPRPEHHDLARHQEADSEPHPRIQRGENRSDGGRDSYSLLAPPAEVSLRDVARTSCKGGCKLQSPQGQRHGGHEGALPP